MYEFSRRYITRDGVPVAKLVAQASLEDGQLLANAANLYERDEELLERIKGDIESRHDV